MRSRRTHSPRSPCRSRPAAASPPFPASRSRPGWDSAGPSAGRRRPGSPVRPRPAQPAGSSRCGPPQSQPDQASYSARTLYSRPSPRGEESNLEADLRDGQRQAPRGRGRAQAAPRLLPARAAAADRDERRLRHVVLRLLHGAAGRRVGEVVHAAGRPGGRARDHHHRGPRRGRRYLPSSAAGLPRATRTPVRLLHAGDGPGGGVLPEGEPATDRGGGATRAGGQPLPLHRLPQHRQGSPGRVRDGDSGVTAVGQAVPRKEDARLLRGQGSYVDNLTANGTLHASIVRSPYAHAAIGGVDVSEAQKAPGVVAVWTGADLEGAWQGGLPCFWPVSDDIKIPRHLPLATDRARYAGDGVAVVIAESRAAAKDAAELVHVDYEPLTAVTEIGAALADGAPLVHDDAPGNVAFTWELVTGEVDKVFADAAVTVKEQYRQQRLIPTSMEPRGVLCEVNAAGDVTVTTSTQGPHIMRTAYTLVLGIPEAKIRVVAPDVGGGFGSKLDVYAEDMMVIVAARRLGRPVKWIEERSEANVATIHGRDVLQEIELAATAEGKITGVRARLKAAMGAYLQAVTPGVPLLGAWLYAGCYAVEAYDFHCTGVFTNTTPTDAYRGAGRPEATYAIERAVDALARKVGKDPVEIRKLNFIDSFPADIDRKSTRLNPVTVKYR